MSLIVPFEALAKCLVITIGSLSKMVQQQTDLFNTRPVQLKYGSKKSDEDHQRYAHSNPLFVVLCDNSARSQTRPQPMQLDTLDKFLSFVNQNFSVFTGERHLALTLRNLEKDEIPI